MSQLRADEHRRLHVDSPHRPVPADTITAIAALLPGVRSEYSDFPALDEVNALATRITRLIPADLDLFNAAQALDSAAPWRPMAGAQSLAWESMHVAQQTLLAGGTGSGKSLPALMLAAMSSRAARFVRKTSGEHVGAMSELAKYVGHVEGRNLGTGRWELGVWAAEHC